MMLMWIDWNFVAYKQSLFVCFMVVLCHHTYYLHKFGHEWSFSNMPLTCLVSFCLWCVYIAWTEGYAVG
jgi:hypothetical protein